MHKHGDEHAIWLLQLKHILPRTEQFKSADLSLYANQWSQVHDFTTGTDNSNWSLLPLEVTWVMGLAVSSNWRSPLCLMASPTGVHLLNSTSVPRQ